MTNEPMKFFEFAYELRSIDKDNVYSERILRDKLEPNVLVDIILANQWDPESDSLKPVVGSGFSLVESLLYRKEGDVGSSWNGGASGMSIFVRKSDNAYVEDAVNTISVQFQLAKQGGLKIILANNEQ